MPSRTPAKYAVPQRSDPHAALAVEARGDVAAVSRVVELVLAGVDDDVVRGQLAVVQARLIDSRLANRWDVFDRHERPALAADGADRRRDGTDPMSEHEVPVDPGLLRQAVRRELAGREHDRRLLPADLVAIDVDVVERVVLAERLELVVRR